MNDEPIQPARPSDVQSVGSDDSERYRGGETVVLSPQPPSLETPRVALRPALGEADDPIVRPASEATATGAKSGRYLIYGEIARGGMGAILRAHDQSLGRDLAIKALLSSHRDKPEMVQRFMEEAQIGGQLQHPGIVPVYELNRFADQRPFFTMKLVKGKSLAAQLRERNDKAEDRSRFLRIFLQVCETMSYAHSRGVIHRDLKPSNIMVGAFGEVQVMDWGLAKVLPAGGVADEQRPHEPRSDATVIRTIRSMGAKSAGSSGQTLDGSVLGTPAYMPPEQASGDVERLDERCDVFGLGAILCEILTGAPPYDSPEHSVVQRKAILGDLREAYERLDGCGADDELVALCKRCLSANREGRPRDAGVLAQELSRYFGAAESRLHEAELTSARMATKAEEERKRRRVTVALAGTVLVALSLLGGGVLWMSQQRSARALEVAQKRLQLSRQVDEALAEAAGHQEQARNNPLNLVPLTQARASVRRAEALLAATSEDDDLRERTRAIAASVEQQERQRNLMERLESARMAGLETNVDSMQTPLAEQFRAYDAAFAAAGVERGKQNPAEAAQRVRDFPSPLREQLVVGLFDWASVASDRLGVAFQIQDGKVLVGAVMPTSPADEDGRLRAGDEILAASPDGRGEMVEAAGKPLDEFSAVMRGPAGQPIRLKVRSKESGQEQIIELTRGKAQVWLKEAVRLAITDPELKQVQKLCDQRDYAKLAETLRQFDPATQSPAVLDMQLELLTEADAPSDLVLSFCRRCQIAHPSDYWLNFRAGMLVANTNPTESLRYMQAAMAARPQDVNVLSWIGEALARSARHTDAEVYFRRGLGFSPRATWLRFSLATTLERLGKTDEAIAELEKVVQEEPDYPPGHGELGRLLAKQGRVEQAMAELRQAVGQAFSYPSSYVNLGICLFNSGDRSESLEMFRRAYEGDGSNAYAYFNLGAALVRMGQPEPARAALARGLELSPNFIGNRLHLGNNRYLRSLLDDQSLAIIAELERQSPAGHLLAAEGQRLLGNGEPDAAVLKLREAVALNPGHSATRRSLGEALAVIGDEAGAIEQFSEAVKADPTDIWNHRHLLQYCALVEKLDQYRAGRAAMLAQFADSADPIILERTAKSCLLLADDHDDVRAAAGWAARSVEMAGESHWAITYLYVCRSLGEYRLGQYEAAAKSARQALSFQFNNWRMQIPANLLLAMADHRLGKTAEARRRLIEATRMYRSPSLANEVDQDVWICECLMREAATTILASGEGGAESSALAALELVALGTGASARRQYAEATLYFERALSAADSHELDLPIIWFYAALAAASAAQSRGTDGAALTDAQRSEHLLRAQRWLRSYIEARTRQYAPNRGWERSALGSRMSSAAFAVFREESELAKQTPEQRETSERLWLDAQSLLARLGE